MSEALNNPGHSLARFLMPLAAEEEVMSDDTLLTRREFTVESALAMLAGVTITITGCVDDDSPTTNPTPATDKTGTVSTDAGHSHTGAVITAAQLGYMLEGIDWRNPVHTWRPSAAG